MTVTLGFSRKNFYLHLLGFLYNGEWIDMPGICHTTKHFGITGNEGRDELPTGCLLSLAELQSELTLGPRLIST